MTRFFGARVWPGLEEAVLGCVWIVIVVMWFYYVGTLRDAGSHDALS